jgi:hypothetical protein
MKTLIDLVIEQIEHDFNNGDLTALEELLNSVPTDKLKGFLSEGNAE